jgi:hypothetical protein
LFTVRADRRGAFANACKRIGNLLGALAHRESIVLSALAIYLALWTGYAAIAKMPQRLHPDMAELFA